MDDVVITVNKSGQKASSTIALGLYYGSSLHDTKGEGITLGNPATCQNKFPKPEQIKKAGVWGWPHLLGHELQAVQERTYTMHVFGQQKLLWRERKDPVLSSPLGTKVPGVTLVLRNDVRGGVAWPGPEQESCRRGSSSTPSPGEAEHHVLRLALALISPGLVFLYCATWASFLLLLAQKHVS